MTPLEIAANLFVTVAIWLAARNHVQTWWTGIVGCALFTALFAQNQLYADATLQLFFIGSSLWGWRQWHRIDHSAQPPVRGTSLRSLALLSLAALLVTALYGSLLKHWTNAYAPFIDSAVLALSVVAQLLLMQRRIENWGFWLVVNTLSVPLFYSRGLYLTSALYAAYWFNAWHGAWHWWRQMKAQAAAPSPSAMSLGPAADAGIPSNQR